MTQAAQPLKIGMFTDSYLPSHDGVATSVYASARELKKRGHEVFIIAPLQPHRTDFQDVYRILSVQLLNEPPIRWGIELPQPAVAKISALEFDLIHGHSGGPISLMGWQVAKIRNVPFIETYHTMWKHYGHYFPLSRLWKPWVLNRISSFFGNRCDALIAPTEKVKKELNSIGVKQPVYVVPSGIDLEIFEEEKMDDFLRDKLGLPKRTKILLTVGRFEKEKDDPFIIRSFAKIAKHFPEVVLVLIGQGREKEKLKRLARALGVEERAYFLDSGIEYRDMPKVYRDSFLFLFASTTESQGLAIVEALAAGLPVVAVEDEAFKGTLTDGENCLLSRKNEKEFEGKIIEVLKSADLHKKLAANACPSVQQFSAKHTSEVLESVYVDVLLRHKMNVGNVWQKIVQALV